MEETEVTALINELAEYVRVLDASFADRNCCRFDRMQLGCGRWSVRYTSFCNVGRFVFGKRKGLGLADHGLRSERRRTYGGLGA